MVNIMKNFKKSLLVASGVSLATAAGLANATVADTITAAFSGAQSNIELAVTAMIVMVAVMTGVGLITRLLGK
jgi:hypothetical protein